MTPNAWDTLPEDLIFGGDDMAIMAGDKCRPDTSNDFCMLKVVVKITSIGILVCMAIATVLLVVVP